MAGTVVLEAILDGRAVEALANDEEVDKLDSESLEFSVSDETNEDIDYVRIYSE